jgi:hypothetical protein
MQSQWLHSLRSRVSPSSLPRQCSSPSPRQTRLPLLVVGWTLGRRLVSQGQSLRRLGAGVLLGPEGFEEFRWGLLRRVGCLQHQ